MQRRQLLLHHEEIKRKKKKKKRQTPLPGIEPGSPAWQAGILTTILQRPCWSWCKNFIIVISSCGGFSPNMFTVCYRLKILSASLLFKFNQIKPVLYTLLIINNTLKGVGTVASHAFYFHSLIYYNNNNYYYYIILYYIIIINCSFFFVFNFFRSFSFFLCLYGFFFFAFLFVFFF